MGEGEEEEGRGGDSRMIEGEHTYEQTYTHSTHDERKRCKGTECVIFGVENVNNVRSRILTSPNRWHMYERVFLLKLKVFDRCCMVRSGVTM